MLLPSTAMLVSKQCWMILFEHLPDGVYYRRQKPFTSAQKYALAGTPEENWGPGGTERYDPLRQTHWLCITDMTLLKLYRAIIIPLAVAGCCFSDCLSRIQPKRKDRCLSLPGSKAG